MRKLMLGTLACLSAGLMAADVANAQKAPRPSPPPPAAGAPAASAPSAQQALDDINRTIGFVPQFLRAFPDALLPGFWASMKGFQMNPNTALDGKTKELIGLAVASQIPCEFCIQFHTIAAKNSGATDQEIKEAVGMAAMTRFASTQLNGMQLDRVQFRKDVDRMMKKEGKKPEAATR